MLLKNNVARLITINGKLDDKGQRAVKFQIKPGNNPATEVPSELCKTSFVKSLVASGALTVLSEDDAALPGDPTKPDLPGKPESLYADFDKAQLVAQCEARGIEVKSRDTATQLIAKLEAADE